MRNITVLLTIFAAAFFCCGTSLSYAVSPETARTVENPAGHAIVGAIGSAAKIAGEKKPANEKPWDDSKYYVVPEKASKEADKKGEQSSP